MAALDFDLSCARCGGVLRGVDPEGSCMHCGERVADSLEINLIDTAGCVVCQDAACVTCGYNLRTLRADAQCPGCFTAVVLSLRPNDLRLADPQWLRKVNGGITLLLVSVTGLGVGPLMIFVDRTGSTSMLPLVLALMVPLLCWILSVIGVVIANKPNPAFRARRRLRISGAARVTAICSILGFFVMANFPFPFMWLWPVLMLVSFSLTLLALRALARRTRCRGLVRLSAVLAYLVLATGAIVIGDGVRLAIVTRGLDPVEMMLTAPPAPRPILYFVASAVVLSAYVLSIVVLFKYRGMLRAAIGSRVAVSS